MPITDFENIDSKFSVAASSEQFSQLNSLISKHDNVYVIGNGGLHYVASHMACDMSRLIDNKYFHSFDSFGFITSSANDFGFDRIFDRWLSLCVSESKPALLIGLSCSGSSKNILNAFDYVKQQGWDTFYITGKQSSYDTPSLCFDCNHYHTVEALSLMLFYEMIHAQGFTCPVI